ncbi:hypothetical protein RRG08_031825 [Elysia crispata]|uniref:Uncharacterized protein n=1 Tax=Elysia crispata TaxID=231223 RepID=A0AAE1CT79_9GAST|nr:hypothetical protein RRG08_031825 [Elysia crispata]
MSSTCGLCRDACPQILSPVCRCAAPPSNSSSDSSLIGDTCPSHHEAITIQVSFGREVAVLVLGIKYGEDRLVSRLVSQQNRAIINRAIRETTRGAIIRRRRGGKWANIRHIRVD